MRLALFQPDIPQNTGAILRLAACFDLPVEVIEPCGFHFDDRRIKRAGLDYTELARLTRHRNWEAFRDLRHERLVLLTTKAAIPHCDFAFAPDDILLFGRESAGVSEEVHAAADARLRIPMAPGRRSLNIVAAAAMVLGEALRQIEGFPPNLPQEEPALQITGRKGAPDP